jgi:hypothetical protein
VWSGDDVGDDNDARRQLTAAVASSALFQETAPFVFTATTPARARCHTVDAADN